MTQAETPQDQNQEEIGRKKAQKAQKKKLMMEPKDTGFVSFLFVTFVLLCGQSLLGFDPAFTDGA